MTVFRIRQQLAEKLTVNLDKRSVTKPKLQAAAETNSKWTSLRTGLHEIFSGEDSLQGLELEWTASEAPQPAKCGLAGAAAVATSLLPVSG